MKKPEYQYCLRSCFIGDFCGAPYEGIQESITKEFLSDSRLIYGQNHRLTDDSVCTMAIADAIMSKNFDWEDSLKRYGKFYDVGYGDKFVLWLHGKIDSGYGSWGNGSAMRVSPIGFYAKTEKECIQLAIDSCRSTHNTEEASYGAVTAALCTFYSKRNKTKKFIKEHVLDKYYPEWSNLTLDTYKEYFINKGEVLDFGWYVAAKNIVPMCIMIFLETNSFEEALKEAISQGFDTDTSGAIISPIAYAYYKEIPLKFINRINQVTTPEQKSLDVIFSKNFVN